jgi:glycosyltransferase involved in cell wall biosynthesis
MTAGNGRIESPGGSRVEIVRDEVRMIKILISAPSMNVERNVSGVSSVVKHIRRALSNDVKFHHLEIGSEQHGGNLTRFFGSLAKMARSVIVVLTSRYDILHSNTAMNAKSIVRDLVMIVIARSRGKAVLLHIHGGTYVHEQPPKILSWALKLLIVLSNYIVVLSRLEQAYFAEKFPESASKIGFVYNGVDLSDGPAQVEVKTSPPGRLRVAFVGRLAPEKGLAILMEACRALNLEDGIRVDFFGDGGLQPEVLNLAQEKDFVTYRGVFQPSESRKVLRDFDALVLPSLRGEGMPMAVIEAMSVGVVPICTPISSIPEIVTNGETGLLIPIGSPEAIVNAVARLGRDPEARRRMGRAAYKFATANFDADKNYGTLNDIYQRIFPRS